MGASAATPVLPESRVSPEAPVGDMTGSTENRQKSSKCGHFGPHRAPVPRFGRQARPPGGLPTEARPQIPPARTVGYAVTNRGDRMSSSGSPAAWGSVYDLAAALQFDEHSYRRAVELAELEPDRAAWLRYVDRFLAAVATALIVAGIASFFAWNWADLHRFAKFGLIETGIVAAVAIAWRFGLESVAGRAALFAAAFLVGVLLALFGQVYQTGADPYGLFVAWAILILPWVLIGRQAGLWLLFVLLIGLALILYWIQVLHPPTGWWQLAQLLGPLVWLGTTVMDWQLATLLFALNAAAIVAWELAAARGAAWLRGRLFPRLVGLVALYTVLAPTLVLIFAAAADHRAGLSVVSPLLLALALAASLWFYQYRRLDLLMLTMSLFAGILVIMALAVRHLFRDFGSLLFLAALLIGLVAGAAFWLRRVSQRAEAAA